MTITSYGYPAVGASSGNIDAVAWSQLQEELGVAYSVQGLSDWAVTVVAGLDRTVAIAAGKGYGRGVFDVNSAPVNVQLDTVAGTGTRWDLIVARRNWTTPVTVFTKVNGTAVAGIPTGRNVGPGALDDQPIALVQITGGQTAPTAVIDLRTWASKVTTTNDLRALVDPRNGDEAVVSDVRYRYVSPGMWVPAGDLPPYVKLIQGAPYSGFGSQVFQNFNFGLADVHGTPGYLSTSGGRVNILQPGVYTFSLDVCLVNDRPTQIEGRIVDSNGNILTRSYAAGQSTTGAYTNASSTHYIPNARSCGLQIMNAAGLGTIITNAATTPNQWVVTRLGG